MSDELLRELIVEVRGLRADLRRQAPADAAALVEALSEFFGGGPFTSTGVLLAAEESPSLADALADVIDMNLPEPARVVSLGKLLATLPELVSAGDRRGARLWRVRR